ncbi:peroxisomal fatty acid beta-oxidation multifunctional protein MFP2 [Physcomitrium patens]|nr:peroxisomal fatty acid beta-oxidation multifunctional protein MFP2-like [Physcomitrium patens]|eukprot:XP_024368113.1 peroxisomal fatty acid beta-oxidation multifunctional protein MFP2-like [Physcomitrella patens]
MSSQCVRRTSLSTTVAKQRERKKKGHGSVKQVACLLIHFSPKLFARQDRISEFYCCDNILQVEKLNQIKGREVELWFCFSRGYFVGEAMTLSVKMDVGADAVAVITIDNPPVNSLAIPALIALKERYNEANARDDVKAIVVTGANGKFSGGFDISVFPKLQEGGSNGYLNQASVDLMIETIEEASKPTVAAVPGLALGGGLELAMSCHARIATPKAQLGLPELQLGILPGFGGTQRLPRLVGLTKALEMMLLSKPIASEEGKKLGLVDEIVAPEDLLTIARRWALDIALGKRPRLSSLQRTDKLESLGDAREIIKFARAQVKKTAPNLTHPLLCLDAVEEGVVAGGYRGALKEAELFAATVVSDNAKGLVNLFFAIRATSKVPGIVELGLKPRKIKKVAVVGGGLMGSGIVTALILSGYSVLLKEINDKFLQAGLERIKANLQSRVKKGKMSREKFETILSLVTGVLTYEDFKSVDVVIEAVIENIDLKQSIFVDLEKNCRTDCILSTNTSTIDLNVLGAKTRSQDRIIGAHFFSPAHIMPLLEIVRTDKTSPQVIVDLMALGKAIKKTTVLVGNCTGFAVNRVFFPYTMAAMMLSDLGVDIYRIDNAIKSWGMPMGPFRLTDLVGFGVGVAVGTQVVNSFSDRVYISRLVPKMLQSQRLGEQNGKGFYIYDEKRKARPAPEIKDIIKESQEEAGIMLDGKPLELTDKDIVEMVMFPVVNEACRVLAEKIVVQASDLDIASVFGMGFPPYRGGIVCWADIIGAKYIASRLNTWTKAHGDFFKPCAFLEERASSGVKLSVPIRNSMSRL